MLIDTGAGISVVHESWLKCHKYVEVAGSSKIYVNASGRKMGTDKFASFMLKTSFAKKNIQVKRALIINDVSVSPNQILLGMPEIKANGLVLDFAKDEISSKLLEMKIDLRRELSTCSVNSLIPLECNVPTEKEGELAKIASRYKVPLDTVKNYPKDF